MNRNGETVGENNVDPSTLETALAFHAQDVCVIPAATDGTKRPGTGQWSDYTRDRPTEKQLYGWFAHDHAGIGIVAGAISGGLVCLDVEGRAVNEGVFDQYKELATNSGLGDVLGAVMGGYTETTASGGRHILWRIDDGQGVANTKLAQRPSTPEELEAKPKQKLQCLIETKSEGGFVIVAPSGGPVHPDGGDWELESGGIDTIATIDREHSDALLELARMLDQIPPPVASEPRRDTGPRRDDGDVLPGDDFEQRTDWAEILEPHGWTLTSQHGRTRYWRRPDKRMGVSATTGRADDRDRLFVFTSSTEFEVEEPITKFHAYTVLEHGGDHGAAAKDLARQGYGTPRPRKLKAVPDPAPHTDGSTALKADPDASDHQVDDTPQVGFNYHQVFGLPEDTKTPDHYRVSAGGVAVRRTSKDEVTWVRFTYAPLAVTATFEDPDGEQYVELAWTDTSRGTRRVISRIVSRSITKRGKELIKQLGGAGLPAVEGNARALELWLAEFESANHAHIPNQQLARWLGWQPDGTFVSSPNEGIKVDVVFEEQRGPLRAHCLQGTMSGWQDTMKGLEPYPVPRIAVAAAFASVLLKVLGVASFTLDFSSRSTKGKTTALQCALSVWANPSEASDAMSNWRTTLYAIEKRLNLVRGIIAVFDETMAVDDEKLIDQVLYQLPLEHGKARSGGAFASMLPWQTILLSSGEKPALSFTKAQGASARILGTTIAPFGDNGGPAAVRARDGVLTNFGHAGPEFVAHLLKGLDKVGGTERLRVMHRDLAEKFRGKNDLTARRAPMVAALALAEVLAHRFGILPYEPLSVDRWKRMFAVQSPTDDRPEMAMDVVREYIASHSHELWPGPPDRPGPPAWGWLGAYKKKGKGAEAEELVAVLPQRLRRILADAGYDWDAVVEGWIGKEYLELRDKQRPAHLIPTSFDGGKARCFLFRARAFEVGDVQGEL
jgi:hypothetical protein